MKAVYEHAHLFFKDAKSKKMFLAPLVDGCLLHGPVNRHKQEIDRILSVDSNINVKDDKANQQADLLVHLLDQASIGSLFLLAVTANTNGTFSTINQEVPDLMRVSKMMVDERDFMCKMYGASNATTLHKFPSCLQQWIYMEDATAPFPKLVSQWGRIRSFRRILIQTLLNNYASLRQKKTHLPPSRTPDSEDVSGFMKRRARGQVRDSVRLIVSDNLSQLFVCPNNNNNHQQATQRSLSTLQGTAATTTAIKEKEQAEQKNKIPGATRLSVSDWMMLVS